jgi:3-oxoacyl-[acyl-carrier protein] reductase
MNLDLEYKGFLVGGGSSGLGRAVAEQLVAEGARVRLVARDQERLERPAEELGENA